MGFGWGVWISLKLSFGFYGTGRVTAVLKIPEREKVNEGEAFGLEVSMTRPEGGGKD